MIADFTKATVEEIEALCNGVGPQNAGWFCRFIPQLVFVDAANRHDWDYTVGGGFSEYTRANLRFYAGCLFAIANKSPLWKWPFHLFVAHFYYVLVKVGGEASFYWTYLPRTQEEMHELAIDKLVEKHFS